MRAVTLYPGECPMIVCDHWPLKHAKIVLLVIARVAAQQSAPGRRATLAASVHHLFCVKQTTLALQSTCSGAVWLGCWRPASMQGVSFVLDPVAILQVCVHSELMPQSRVYWSCSLVSYNPEECLHIDQPLL